VNGAKVAISTGADATVRGWRLPDCGQHGQPLTGHRRTVSSISCEVLDGTPIAVTAGEDGLLLVWDLSAHKLIGDPVAGHAAWVSAVACALIHGRLIAVSGSVDGSVRVVDLSSRSAKRVSISDSEQSTGPMRYAHRGVAAWGFTLSSTHGRGVVKLGFADGTAAVVDLATGAAASAVADSQAIPGREAARASVRIRHGERSIVADGRIHAPNAMDNFCFDVTLSYRRLERPRRLTGGV
jgi:WD40 repeat protein